MIDMIDMYDRYDRQSHDGQTHSLKPSFINLHGQNP